MEMKKNEVKIKMGCILAVILQLHFPCFSQQHNQRPPNVILILTDDQGIGDIGCHGNPWIQTPNLDRFYKKSVRMTDFHVSPVCTPTRAAIMTGRYPITIGTWATYKGRDALPGNAITMADVFKANGYTTGIFGKWHLGDMERFYPTRHGFDRWMGIPYSNDMDWEVDGITSTNIFNPLQPRSVPPQALPCSPFQRM